MDKDRFKQPSAVYVLCYLAACFDLLFIFIIIAYLPVGLKRQAYVIVVVELWLSQKATTSGYKWVSFHCKLCL